MSTTRFFDGARANKQIGQAARLKKLEIQKGGKLALAPAERYKLILMQKTLEHQQKVEMARAASGHKISKRTEQAIAERAKRKAIKEEKKMRQMVVIKPRSYGDVGRMDSKGRVFDQVSNITLKVDAKTGKIKTAGGWTVGKYKPKSFSHEGLMKESIIKWSPYHIRLRQLQLQEQVATMYAMQHSMGISVHGEGDNPSAVSIYGQDPSAQRGNVSVNGWGVMSGNVHGTFGENAWGTFADNVWGRAESNIWGGIGDSGGLWKGAAHKVWGSGRQGQKNYIRIGFKIAVAFFGLAQRNRYGSYGSGGSSHDDHMRNSGGSHDHLRSGGGHEAHESHGPAVSRSGGGSSGGSAPRSSGGGGPRSGGGH